MSKRYPHGLLAAALLIGLGAAGPSRADGDPGVFGVSVGALAVLPDVDSPVLGADATNNVIPVVSFHWYLPFFQERLSLNTALGVTRHRVTDSSGAELGKVSTVPLNLTLQYRFLPPGKGFSPFVGAGVNHTIFSRERGPAFSQVSTLKDTTGAVVQAGFDYWFSKNFFVNVDVRKFYISTDVRLQNGPKIEKIDLDPLAIGANVGYRF